MLGVFARPSAMESEKERTFTGTIKLWNVEQAKIYIKARGDNGQYQITLTEFGDAKEGIAPSGRKMRICAEYS